MEFGMALRRERERRGISLEAVAESTKIGLALLAGLERGDLSRWPTGIFRRAFIRAYAEAIGLGPDETVGRFDRAFGSGEVGEGAVESVDRGGYEVDPLRLTLARSPRQTARALAVRAAAVLADGLAVAAAGVGLATVAQQPVVSMALGAGALYFAAGTLLCECSPATWALRRASRSRPVTAPKSHASVEAVRTVQDDNSLRRVEVAGGPRSVLRERRHVRAERRRATRGVQRPS
jgi:transcriptional regulator with XRE-family HTH domain